MERPEAHLRLSNPFQYGATPEPPLRGSPLSFWRPEAPRCLSEQLNPTGGFGHEPFFSVCSGTSPVAERALPTASSSPHIPPIQNQFLQEEIHAARAATALTRIVFLDTNAIWSTLAAKQLEAERYEARPRPSPSLAVASAFRFATFPYTTAIRNLLEHDQVPAARRLLASAIQDIGSRGELAVLERLLAPPRIRRRADLRDTDRRAELRTLAQESAQYHGQWVAVVNAEIVASAPRLNELLASLKTMHLARVPLIHHVA